MSALSDEVPIPPKDQMNPGLSSAREDTMMGKFGKPGPLTPDCSDPSGEFKKRIVWGIDVGPFKVSGLGFAVESLKQIFAEVRRDLPVVFAEAKTAGVLCVRHRRHNPSRYSNHSWGTAIDLYFGNKVVPQGHPVTHRGVLRTILVLAYQWDMLGPPPVKLDSAAFQLFRLDATGRPTPWRINLR